MANIFKPINKKVNGLIRNLIITGFILLVLGVLIVWTDFMLRLVIGMIAIAIAYIFFYGAYKIWALKKEIKKYLKF